MVYAAVARPPVLGSKVTQRRRRGGDERWRACRMSSASPRRTPPYVFKALGGAAVIADNTWAAMQGRKALNVDVERQPARRRSTRRRSASSSSRPCNAPQKALRNVGDVDEAFSRRAKTHEASYYTAMLAHAPMEPPAAVAEFRDGKVVTWAATQNPQAVQEAVADALGIAKADVTCHVTLLGGGFGRKSKPDYVVEAALLSKQVGKPVKIVWSREDDLQFDYFHAPSAQYLKAASARRAADGWLLRTAFPPIGSIWNAEGAVRRMAGESGLHRHSVSAREPARRERPGAGAHAHRLAALGGHIHHAFAVQSFTDELAALANADRVEYLLKLIGAPRVIDFARRGSDRLEGRGHAIRVRHRAAAPRHRSRRREVRLGEEEVRRAPGLRNRRALELPLVHRCRRRSGGQRRAARCRSRASIIAVDAGTIVNPDRVVSQFEGAAVFGTSLALMSEMTAANGKIQESNFDSYQLARMNASAAQTHVHLVPSTAAPAGVGEPGVPPIAPAICNAIFAATGKRMRELPIAAQLKQA